VAITIIVQGISLNPLWVDSPLLYHDWRNEKRRFEIYINEDYI